MNQHVLQQPGDPRSPSDDDIAALLRTYQPQPRARFYTRIARLPWMAQPPAVERARGPALRWFTIGIATALLLVVSLTVATPPLRAAVSVWLGFQRAETNIVTNASTGFGADFATFGDLVAADMLTPYQVREPTDLPAGFQFATGKHWPAQDAIELTYRRPAPAFPRRSETLYVREWPFDPRVTDPVGADARIEEVTIGDTRGQWITGQWVARPTEQAGPPRAGWTEFAFLPRLRWRDGDVWLEVSASSGSFSKAELIAVAETIRPTEPEQP